MADIKAWFRGSRKIWYAGTIIAMGLLWAAEHPFFLCHPALQLFIREVAFALLIACAFGLTIEQIQRREFIRLVTEEREVLKRDVFLYAYGSNLPDSIRHQIQDTILTQSFGRSDLVVDWEFHAIRDIPDFLEVKKRYSYTIINNSNDTKGWQFAFTQVGADEQEAISESTFVVLRIRRGDQFEEYKVGRLKVEEPEGQPHSKRISTVIDVQAHKSIEVYYEVLQRRRWWPIPS